ncbi:MAG: hypothetical protein ABI597_13575 [Gammaproteobacteria bacterium]
MAKIILNDRYVHDNMDTEGDIESGEQLQREREEESYDPNYTFSLTFFSPAAGKTQEDTSDKPDAENKSAQNMKKS